MADFINVQLGGRYEVQERIGAGGMARVFKAWDSNLERWVAVKILHEHLVEDPTFAQRFTREAKLVASLNHPNIVQIYDYSFVERDGVTYYYMVMPFIAGDTLRTILDRCARTGIRLPRPQVVRILRELCNALGYAHERGMLHRDIKPGNVIIDENGRTILMDFGIARMVEATRLTMDSLTTGTPAYMSPEQANGQPGDARSDLYALGVMLFEMITSRLPYTDEGGLSVIVKHMYAPVPRISDVLEVEEPELDQIIVSTLAKSPDDRYPNASSMSAALRALPIQQSANDTLLFSDDMTSELIERSVTPLPGSMTPAASQTPILTSASGHTTRLISRRFTYSVASFGLLLMAIVVIALLLRPAALAPASTESAPPPIDPLTAFNQEGFTANFAPNDADISKFPQTSDDSLERTVDTEQGIYSIVNRLPNNAMTTLVQTEKPYANVTITMVATLDSSSAPSSAYGIVFRYQDENNYNVFTIDGLGRYSIWVRETGMWRELRNVGENWTENPNVASIGEQNRLRINITQAGFTLYINNQPVGSPVEDNTFTAGTVGVYLATPGEGSGDAQALLSVDMFEVYPIIPAMTEPGQMG